MKLQPYIIVLLIIAALISCRNDRFNTMGLQQAATLILGDSLKMIRWKLSQTYDPYMGGRITRQDSDNPRILELYNNGTFKVYEDELLDRGKWYVKSDKSAIAFIYESENKETSSATDQEITFTHQIRKLTQDTMILAWQGRHGFIEELYVAQKTAQTQNILPVNRPNMDLSSAKDTTK